MRGGSIARCPLFLNSLASAVHAYVKSVVRRFNIFTADQLGAAINEHQRFHSVVADPQKFLSLNSYVEAKYACPPSLFALHRL